MSEPARIEIEFQLNPTVRAVNRQERAEPEAPPVRHRYTRFPRIVQVMALAIHFQEMLERGEARDYADLARLGCVSRERISQIMMLRWLAPEIQQEVLGLPKTPGGRFPVSETALRAVAKVVRWEEQRGRWEGLAEAPTG
jgi:hypothetical protein